MQFSYAQWTTSGSNIYNSNTGNVGIGNTNPQAIFSVKGSTLPGNIWSGYASSLQVGELLIQDYTAVPQVGISQNSYFDGTSTKYILNGYSTTLGMGSNGGIEFAVYNSGTSGTSVSGTGIAMKIANNGNVGIGTTSPTAKLDVKGSIVFGNVNSNGRLSDETGYASVVGGVGAGIKFYTNDGISQPLTLSSTGNVGIGATPINEYKLAVNGAAIATSMKVKLQANWPDFVFLKDYKLPTLTEVKTYIDKNQHLPDMPSADEVHASGLDLGEMNRLLLKKVEELTLYLIEKDKQLKEQNERINKLEKSGQN
ncbi:hypothetical protein [Mucilaginibacter sp. HD30]